MDPCIRYRKALYGPILEKLELWREGETLSRQELFQHMYEYQELALQDVSRAVQRLRFEPVDIIDLTADEQDFIDLTQ